MNSYLSSSSDASDDDLIVLDDVVAVSQMICDSERGSSDLVHHWDGSSFGQSPNILRDFEGAYNMVVYHNFSGAYSLYDKDTFERRIGCPRSLVG